MIANDSQEAVERVIAFLERTFRLEDGANMDENYSISHDFGISGLDAEMLIERFVSEFNVDMSDFPFSNYFWGEGEELSFFRRKYWKTRKKTIQENNLTIGLLARAVKNGKWIET